VGEVCGRLERGARARFTLGVVAGQELVEPGLGHPVVPGHFAYGLPFGPDHPDQVRRHLHRGTSSKVSTMSRDICPLSPELTYRRPLS